jgi:hypothetical protein
MSKHHRILQALLDSLEKFAPETHAELNKLSLVALEDLCFCKHRTDRGFRLTMSGFKFFQLAFQHWKVKLVDGYRITGRHLIYLGREVTAPWYLEYEGRGVERKVEFASFDPDFALRLKLTGGDIGLLADSADAAYAAGLAEKI